jgi:hypothetical protein
MSLMPKDDEQFVLSYELLAVLRWLTEHEQESLKKVFAQAIKRGFKEEWLHANDLQKEQNIENLQSIITEFFSLIEALAHETVNEHEITTVLQRTTVPAVYHVDTTACDVTSVALSAAKATAAVKNNTGENPKEVLCRELLRHWKPCKKMDVN